MTIRWGVAGPGSAAVGFAKAMEFVEDGEIAAVASRSGSRAEAFARRFAVPAAYDDYLALADDPNVDAVYIATPHARHCNDTLLYVSAAKHVLCEKPFALTRGQAESMVTAAAEQGVFLMEAIWSRFLPTYQALKAVLESGDIGEPLLVAADFGMKVPTDPEHRLFDPQLGGGALLELGIYPLQLCSLVLGEPETVVAKGFTGATGVDEQVAAVLQHPNTGLGVVTAAIRASTGCSARISASHGSVDVPAYMHCPEYLTVTDSRGVHQVDGPLGKGPLRFEIMEVHRCINQGLRESQEMPLRETVALAGTMDTIRKQLRLCYPSE